MNINCDWLSSAGTGIASGSFVAQAQSNEKVFFKSRNYYLASVYQQVTVWQAFRQCSAIFSTIMQNRLEVLNAPVNLALSSLYYATHSLIFFSACIKNSEISSGTSVCDGPYNFIIKKTEKATFHKLRKITDLTARHMGDIVQVVNVAYAGLKYYQGLKADAIASLVIMGIGILDRNNYLHPKISVVFNKCLPSISSVGILLSASPLLIKVAAGAILINEIAPRLIQFIRNSMDRSFHAYYATFGAEYPDLKALANPQPPLENVVLDLTIEKAQVEVDFNHLGLQPSLSLDTHEFTLDDYKGRFFSIEWREEKNFEELEKALLNDNAVIEHFNDLFSLSSPTTNNVIIKNQRSFVKEPKPHYTFNPELTDARDTWRNLLINLAETKMTTFIGNLTGENRIPGDLTGLEDVKQRALQVLSFLKTLSSDNKEELVLKRKIILELMLNGSDYSFHMMRQSINKCYNMVLSNIITTKKTASFRDRVIHTLQQKRMELVRTWYDTIQKVSPISFQSMIGFDIMSDPHIYNEFYNFIFNGLGLDEGSLGHDRTVEYIPPLGFAVRTILPYYRHAFFASSPYETENKVECTKQTLEIMQVAMKSIKSTIFRQEGQTYYTRGLALLKGIYTVPRDAIRFCNAAVFLYFKAIAGSYRYDRNTVIKTFNENIDKAFTKDEIDDWWTKKLAGHPNKVEINEERANNPEKFTLLMLIDMGILKKREALKEVHAFDLKSNLFDQVGKYVIT